MQITISVRHGHLSETTQEKIREKVERLSRLFDRLMAIEVTVDLEHEDSPGLEIRATAEHHKEFVAADSAPNVSSALDRVLPKIEQQIRKHKEKLTGHKATSHKRMDTGAESESD